MQPTMRAGRLVYVIPHGAESQGNASVPRADGRGTGRSGREVQPGADRRETLTQPLQTAGVAPQGANGRAAEKFGT